MTGISHRRARAAAIIAVALLPGASFVAARPLAADNPAQAPATTPR